MHERAVGCGQIAVGLEEDALRAAKGLACGVGRGPGFFGGKAQKRRHPAQHGVGDVVQRGLGTAASHAFLCRGVEAVFEHVQIKATQILAAILLQLAHHGVKFVHRIVAQYVSLQLCGAAKGVAVYFKKLIQRQRISGHIKVVQIGH